MKVVTEECPIQHGGIFFSNCAWKWRIDSSHPSLVVSPQRSIEFDSVLRKLSSHSCNRIPNCPKLAVLPSTGITGDGRCLFRSVVHGAYLRAGKQSLKESVQKELADELRAKVTDEFVKRRAETEWFLEGDFETYISQMRQPHIWGGEPELLMCSHVLQMPITVHMEEKNSGSLKVIAEYGREYGLDDPIRVLYHCYGHYDALLGPVGTVQSKTRPLI